MKRRLLTIATVLVLTTMFACESTFDEAANEATIEVQAATEDDDEPHEIAPGEREAREKKKVQ